MSRDIADLRNAVNQVWSGLQIKDMVMINAIRDQMEVARRQLEYNPLDAPTTSDLEELERIAYRLVHLINNIPQVYNKELERAQALKEQLEDLDAMVFPSLPNKLPIVTTAINIDPDPYDFITTTPTSNS